MKLKIVLIIGFSILMLTGCIKEPTPKGTINLNNQVDEKFNLIYKLSKQCFEKDSSAFSDGILILAVQNDWHNQILFHRHAFDIGLTEPFITLNFKNNKVYITEGTYQCSYNGCIELNIKNKIKNWLRGSSSCK